MKPGACGAMLEDVGDAERGWQAFDLGFEELQVWGVRHVHGVETIGFGPGHVTRRGAAFRICVFVMADQRLPVRVTGSLD
jgi:hypothetical protein